MRKALVPAFLLVLGSVVLGATVLREPIARAASPFTNVIVSNTDTNPVPVHEQGTAAVRVTGTAEVNVTNSSLALAPPEPVTGGASPLPLSFTGGTNQTMGTLTASALVITMTSDIAAIEFKDSGNLVAEFPGPFEGGVGEIVLPLDRPISFDEIDCVGSGLCTIGTVGNTR